MFLGQRFMQIFYEYGLKDIIYRESFFYIVLNIISHKVKCSDIDILKMILTWCFISIKLA